MNYTRLAGQTGVNGVVTKKADDLIDSSKSRLEELRKKRAAEKAAKEGAMGG